jgi:hypothetical protein
MLGVNTQSAQRLAQQQATDQFPDFTLEALAPCNLNAPLRNNLELFQ